MKKILLLLGQKENSHLLSQLLANNYQVHLPSNLDDQTTLDYFKQPFDLCIIDNLVLQKYYELLEIRRKKEEPLFLPVMLLVNNHQKRMIITYLQCETIDEVIMIPVDKIELILRIKILLRMRELSLNLQASIKKEQLLTKKLQIANKKLQHLSTVDGLTKIANRRFFDLSISREWNRVQRAEKFIFLMLCDVDFFKLYNDIYGHQKGDDCLRKVAQIIHKNAQRPGDLAARYGGEEFAVILPDTSAAGAVHVAKLIQSDLESCAIAHQGSQVSQFVTLSIGIAGVIPNQNISVEQLIKLADDALDQAKRNGRNLVIIKDKYQE